MADEAGHVTMLQRSPTYFYPRPNVDELADELRGLEIPDEWVHEIIRRRNLRDGQIIHQMSAEYPEMMVDELIKAAREYLPEGFDIDTHFRPAYKPWTQRIAVLPDGDLFKGIASGDVDIVTDHIDTFTEQGVLLESGIELAADIIVTATGFHLNALGDTQMSIDGEPLDYAGTVTYRGVMFSDVPNMATVFGYLRTSWTMRSDLISDFVCRLLNHMDAIGATVCTPTIAPEDADMELGPFVPPESFNPGYMQRGRHLMPKQGTKAPWTASNDYYIEKDEFPVIDLDEPELHYR